MKINVTDFERVRYVQVGKDGTFKCPKCEGQCKPRKDKSGVDYDCIGCSRGWTKVPLRIQTVEQAHKYLKEIED